MRNRPRTTGRKTDKPRTPRRGKQVKDPFHQLLARAYAREKTGAWADAADLYRQAIEKRPEASLPLVALGRCLVRMSGTQEAVSVLSKALEIVEATANPRVCCEAHFHLGCALDMEGETTRSFMHYQDALGYSRDAGDAIIEGAATQVMAGVFLRDGRLDLAERYLGNAVEIYTKDAPSPEHLQECEQMLAELKRLGKERKPRSGLVKKILGAAAAAAAGIFLVWALGHTGGEDNA